MPWGRRSMAPRPRIGWRTGSLKGGYRQPCRARRADRAARWRFWMTAPCRPRSGPGGRPEPPGWPRCACAKAVRDRRQSLLICVTIKRLFLLSTGSQLDPSPRGRRQMIRLNDNPKLLAPAAAACAAGRLCRADADRADHHRRAARGQKPDRCSRMRITPAAIMRSRRSPIRRRRRTARAMASRRPRSALASAPPRVRFSARPPAMPGMGAAIGAGAGLLGGSAVGARPDPAQGTRPAADLQQRLCAVHDLQGQHHRAGLQLCGAGLRLRSAGLRLRAGLLRTGLVSRRQVTFVALLRGGSFHPRKRTPCELQQGRCAPSRPRATVKQKGCDG